MPFVQRNWKGEITGLYSGPQPQPDGTCLTEPDPLPDDHPEVAGFREKHPIPDEMLKPPTEKERQRIDEMHRRVEDEHKAIQSNINAFNKNFARLEISLSTLLYSALNISMGHVAYAIFYSPTSFAARAKIVENVIIQMAAEHKPLAALILSDKKKSPYHKIAAAISTCNDTRNRLAHGVPQTFALGRENYARVAAPAFDVVRVGRHLASGQIPGLTAISIADDVRKLATLCDCIGRVNELMAAFHDPGNPTLPQKYERLELHLTKLDSLKSPPQTPSE